MKKIPNLLLVLLFIILAFFMLVITVKYFITFLFTLIIYACGFAL